MANFLDVRADSEVLNKVNQAYASAATAGFAEDSAGSLDLLASAMGLTAGEALSPDTFTQEDDLGLSHTRYRQRISGVPVWGSQITITRSNDGNVRRMHGVVAQGVAAELPDVAPAYSPEEAVEHVKQVLRGESDLGDATRFTGETSELVVYLDDSGSSRLCYDVRMGTDLKRGGGRPTSPRFLIDAKTKETVLHFDELATFIPSSSDALPASVISGEWGSTQAVNGIPGKGTGPGGNLRSRRYQYGMDLPAFDVTIEGEDYIMETPQVRTIDLKHGEARKTGAYRYKGPDNTHKEINGAFCPLNDAHCFGQVVFAMYNDWLGTSPLGPNQLILGVHFHSQYENAFWSPSDRMMGFGDGRDRMYPLVSLDVLAHEVSHGFTDLHSQLIYQEQECGGINEAFSDMAGEAAEFYLRQTNDFLVGATIMKAEGTALRYMDNPPKDGRSIASAKDFRVGLDMHYSSGVYNKAFYTLATTPGWDTRQAFEVFARANMRYWGPKTNFVQGARGVVDAATDLGYPTADVIAAFAIVDLAL